jgi:hypothetical protein
MENKSNKATALRSEGERMLNTRLVEIEQNELEVGREDYNRFKPHKFTI